MLVVCGGSWNSQENDKCYQLKTTLLLGAHQGQEDDSMNGPTVVKVMKERRQGAASVTIANGTALWVTGGQSGIAETPTESTELVDLSMSTDSSLSLSGEGVSMPVPLAYHCLQVANAKTVLLVGGLQNGKEEPTNSAWTVDIDSITEISLTGGWTPQASMKLGRYRHSCGVLKQDMSNSSSKGKFIVVVGGIAWPDYVKKEAETVELLRLNDDDEFAERWEWGPPLPDYLVDASSATTNDHNVLFVVGGNSVVSSSMFIYSFRCALSFCWWSKEDAELLFPRSNGIAMIIPPASALQHQASDGKCSVNVVG